jgi:hypothetical protein
MATTLQPVLAGCEGTTSDLSVFLSRAEKNYDVYIGVALLERVGVDPEVIQRKMLVGRLFNAGFSQRKLSETFRHDARTIKKWAAAIVSGDIDEMASAFTGRGGTRKISPELIRYAQQLYRDRQMLGRNYRQIIISKIEEVFCVRISATVASAIFRAESDHSRSTSVPEKVATGEHQEDDFCSNVSGSVKRSPTPLPVQKSESTHRSEQLIHHAGQAIFANEMKGFSDPLQRQLIGQILQGAVNIEQSKTLCGRSLANFTGPVVSSLREQRDRLDLQAKQEYIQQIYELNAQLLADGPNRGDLFYFDPHTKEYTGQLKVLKGWCGRRHGITKVMNLDSFHTRSGRPCFVQHYSAFYDMRERFFMSLFQFDRLFDVDKRQKRTFVIDRGIYGLTTLQNFGEDHVITWEKNYSGDGWDDNKSEVCFTRSRTKNHCSDHQYINFKCQQSVWGRDSTFRRIIVRVSRPRRKDIEVSIITSHPDMDIQDVVWAIFRRWVQENDFKYLDTHFGFNQLTSRDSSSFREQADHFEDRPVDCPEYKELKNSIQALEAKLGRKLVQRRKNEKQERELKVQQSKLDIPEAKLLRRLKRVLSHLENDHPIPRGSRNIQKESADFRSRRRKMTQKLVANAKRQTKQNTEIARVESEIEPLEAQLCSALRKQSRLQLLSDAEYRMLDPRKKSMMDALRVAASNIFRNVQEQFRAIADDFRDDHVVVRMLSRCTGTMTCTGCSAQFKLWLPGTLQPHRIRELQSLLDKIQEQINNQISSARTISLKLISGPIAL